MNATEWRYKNIHLIGTSIAGIRTCICWPEMDVAFDVAQGLPFALTTNRFLISHGHMDHAAGIPYIISQKALHKHKPAHFYMPPSLVEPLKEILQIWEKIEAHQYSYHFHAIELQKDYELNNEHFFRAFPTVHRVPSCGYTIFRKHKTLKPELSQAQPQELAKMRKEGIEVHNVRETPLVSFTGDTQIEYLEKTDWVRKSQVLLTEVTYVDEKKSVTSAREWGHIHLDEFIPWLERLECEKVVLIHLSSRYRPDYVESILDKRLPAHLRDKVEVFPWG